MLLACRPAKKQNTEVPLPRIGFTIEILFEAKYICRMMVDVETVTAINTTLLACFHQMQCPRALRLHQLVLTHANALLPSLNLPCFFCPHHAIIR